MFINDVHKKEEIRNIAVQDLKQLGIKYRSKKPRQHVQEPRSRKLFRTHLQSLPMEIVTLPSGQQLIVPKIVHELCSYIVTKIDTEGLFRKGGSKSRQNEIRLSLDAGCLLGDEHHEIDVASILKTFFRELPEPLIPYSYHELFLRCTLLPKTQVDAVLLSCLLLPTEHLNTLAYFMQFLYRVSEYMQFNKMDAYNLAVVMGPTLLPAEEKLPHSTAQQRLLKTCELFKLLIENASNIGELSESIIERIALTSSSHSLNDEDAMSIKKKKKRRSGSLTRMFSGLKKIVTNKIDEVAQTPDILMTPSLTRSAKKRKVESNGLSTKKRREILSNLPHNAILNTPYTPSRTPVNCHPNGNKKISPDSSKPELIAKEKRLLWSTRSKPKKLPEEPAATTRSSIGPTSIQRRWSAVSSAAGFKKKKTRNSCAGSMGHPKPKILDKDPQIDNRINDLSEELTKKKTPDDENYVRISKIEYEDIKNRVTAIERRISIELDQVAAPTDECVPQNGLDNVEKAYVETLEQAQSLSPTTDQLAKRLSKDLKIRGSSEHKVFRSPSARKIGSLRRRSREGNQVRLTRTQTWCVSSAAPKTALKRGRPNTVLSGLPQPNTDEKMDVVQNIQPIQRVTRSSSFQADVTKSPKNISSSLLSNASTTSWKSAQGFFNTPLMSSPSFENCRASLAKLRSQNAGMVLAKARLFDNLVDSGSSSQAEDAAPATRPNKSHKIGAPRAEARQSSRVRTLRMEDRRLSKKMMSPRKRSCKSPGGARMHKLQTLRNNISGGTDESLYTLKDSIRSGSQSPKFTTPRSVPHIKRPLNTKSPRRICRTPNVEGRQTPLKVVAQMKEQY